MISYSNCKISTNDFFFNNYVYKTKLQVHKMFMKYSFSSCFVRYQQKSTAVAAIYAPKL